MFKLCELGSKVTDHNYGHLHNESGVPLKGGMVVAYNYAPIDENTTDTIGNLHVPVVGDNQAIVANPLDNYTFKVGATEDDFEYPQDAFTKVYPMYALNRQYIYLSKDVFASSIRNNTFTAGNKLYPYFLGTGNDRCTWYTQAGQGGYCLIIGGDLGDKVWGEIVTVNP